MAAGAGRARMRLSFSGKPPGSCKAGTAVAADAQPGEMEAGAEEGGGAGLAAEPEEARQRPLVAVVEATEACDMAALRDLILVLSEARPPPGASQTPSPSCSLFMGLPSWLLDTRQTEPRRKAAAVITRPVLGVSCCGPSADGSHTLLALPHSACNAQALFIVHHA